MFLLIRKTIDIGTDRIVPSTQNLVMPTSGIVAQSLSKQFKAEKDYSVNMKSQRRSLGSDIKHLSIQKSDKSSIYKPVISLK